MDDKDCFGTKRHEHLEPKRHLRAAVANSPGLKTQKESFPQPVLQTDLATKDESSRKKFHQIEIEKRRTLTETKGIEILLARRTRQRTSEQSSQEGEKGDAKAAATRH